MSLFNSFFSKPKQDLDQPDTPLQEPVQDPRQLVPEGSQLVMSFDEPQQQDPVAAQVAEAVTEALTMNTEDTGRLQIPQADPEPEEVPAPAPEAAPILTDDDQFLAELPSLAEKKPEKRKENSGRHNNNDRKQNRDHRRNGNDARRDRRQEKPRPEVKNVTVRTFGRKKKQENEA